jgi:DNA repair protein RecO (recombination protein O)
MNLLRTAAVVLKVVDHGESDKIVTFYSAAAGRQTGIAKGAKRSTKRFVNKLELFSSLEIGYHRRYQNALAQIVEADLLDPHINLRRDHDRYIAASLITELVIGWVRDNDAEPALFSTLVWALHGLDQGWQPLTTVILFQTKLLGIVGYRPHLSSCIICGGAESSGAPYGFNLGHGGVICGRCRGETAAPAAHIPLSLSTMKLMHSAQEMGLEKLQRLRFSDSSRTEAAALLKKYCEYLLQREIQSWTAFGL